MLAISAGLLFICVTVVVGFLLVETIPQNYKPEVVTPWSFIRWLVVLIAVLSFVPVWNIISVFSADLGFWVTFESVMFTFREGTAYWLTLGICVSLFISLFGSKTMKGPKAILIWFLLILLVYVQGMGSHASTLISWGSWAQTIHLASIYAWVGPVFVVAWFAKTDEHWKEFLRWFTPVSILCVIALSASGWALMGVIVPEYRNAWMLPYGQALLLKHLIYVPVLLTAFCNGILSKQIGNKGHFNPRPWLRAEGILLLLIFLMSGTLSVSTPPHDVSLTLNEAHASALFQWFLNEPLDKNLDVIMEMGPVQYMMAAVAAAGLAGVLVTFLRRKHALYGTGFALLAVVCGYFAVMSSVRLG